MTVKRKLKNIYKETLQKIGTTRMGERVGAFFAGSATIMQMETGKARRGELSTRLMVKDLIGEKENRNDCFPAGFVGAAEGDANPRKDKIAVRVIHCNPATYSAVETVCEEFQKDSRYDLKVILIVESGQSIQLARQMEDHGIPYVYSNVYRFEQDRPDITIVYHLEYNYPYNILKAREYTKFLVYVPLTLTTIWYGDDKVGRLFLERFCPDCIFATELVMERLRKCAPGYRLFAMIPPQMDTVYRRLQTEPVYPKGWEKLRGKKVFFYMTDHGLQEYFVANEVSFDLYLPTLMEYVKRAENQNIGLIIRPHFSLIRELIAYYWSLEDYRRFVEYCNDSPNIVWDETTDYLNGLCICDAVLSDLNTSVTYFALASRKPIAVTVRYDMPVKMLNKGLTDSLYVLHAKESCIRYLDMVKQGKDVMKHKREQVFEWLAAPFDGCNGKRIKETIQREYDRRF